MNDKEVGQLSEKLTTSVALMCRATTERVDSGAPRISLCISGCLGALVGVQAYLFGRAPATIKEQNDFHLYACLVVGRACSGVTSPGGKEILGTEVNFEPALLIDSMVDFEKLTGRKFAENNFKSQWAEAIKEERSVPDNLKSQFGQFFPQ